MGAFSRLAFKINLNKNGHCLWAAYIFYLCKEMYNQKQKIINFTYSWLNGEVKCIGTFKVARRGMQKRAAQILPDSTLGDSRRNSASFFFFLYLLLLFSRKKTENYYASGLLRCIRLEQNARKFREAEWFLGAQVEVSWSAWRKRFLTKIFCLH